MSSKMNTPWHTTEARSLETPSPRALAGETYYTVLVSSAKMPGTCWGRYSRVAILECERGHVPKQIRDTIKQRLIRVWERCHVGSTPRSAVGRAMAEADLSVAQLTAAIALHRAMPAEVRPDLSTVAARTCPVSGIISHA